MTGFTKGSDNQGGDLNDETEIVVLSGQTLRHGGKTYAGNSRLFLPHSDAVRLTDSGVATEVKALRQQTASATGVSVSLNDGVKISRGE